MALCKHHDERQHRQPRQKCGERPGMMWQPRRISLCKHTSEGWKHRAEITTKCEWKPPLENVNLRMQWYQTTQTHKHTHTQPPIHPLAYVVPVNVSSLNFSWLHRWHSCCRRQPFASSPILLRARSRWLRLVPIHCINVIICYYMNNKFWLHALQCRIYKKWNANAVLPCHYFSTIFLRLSLLLYLYLRGGFWVWEKTIVQWHPDILHVFVHAWIKDYVVCVVVVAIIAMVWGMWHGNVCLHRQRQTQTETSMTMVYTPPASNTKLTTWNACRSRILDR